MYLFILWNTSNDQNHWNKAVILWQIQYVNSNSIMSALVIVAGCSFETNWFPKHEEILHNHCHGNLIWDKIQSFLGKIKRKWSIKIELFSNFRNFWKNVLRRLDLLGKYVKWGSSKMQIHLIQPLFRNAIPSEKICSRNVIPAICSIPRFQIFLFRNEI